MYGVLLLLLLVRLLRLRPGLAALLFSACRCPTSAQRHLSAETRRDPSEIRADRCLRNYPGCSSDPVPSGTAAARPRVLCAPFRVAAAHLRCNGQRASGSSCCGATAALPSLPSQPASHRGSAGATRVRYQHAAAPPTVAKWTRHRRPFSSPRKLLLAPQKEGQKACRSTVAGSVVRAGPRDYIIATTDGTA